MTPSAAASTAPRRAPRADGLRNRRQVLEAAGDAFSAEGMNASVRTISRDASVGVGTLYRHFPTKEHLLAEVVKMRLGELLETSRAIQDDATEDDPGARLVRWTEAAAAHIGRFASVSGWVTTALAEDADLHALHEQVLTTGDALLHAAQSAGRAVDSVTIADLVAAIAALSAPAPGDPGRAGRLIALLTEGVLRPR